MEKIEYSKAKKRIVEFTKKNFPSFYNHDEFNAAITHWIHTPEICPPLMPKQLFIQLVALFEFK